MSYQESGPPVLWHEPWVSHLEASSLGDNEAQAVLADGRFDSVHDHDLSQARRQYALCPQAHPSRVYCCRTLFRSLERWFGITGTGVTVNECIKVGTELLGLIPCDDPERGDLCVSLARFLDARFNQTGDDSLLIEAIDLHREVQQSRSRDHPARADLSTNFAKLLMERFRRTGHDSLLDEAVECSREALLLRPMGHIDRATSCTNLAEILHTRSHRTGDDSLLDEAITLEKDALVLRPKDDPGQALSCRNLSVFLKTRFDRSGSSSSLHDAITLGKEALRRQPVGHPDRAVTCANLAICLQDQYEYTKNKASLDEAINLGQEALDLRPMGHPDRAASYANLATSLSLRYGHTKQMLQGANALWIKALKLVPRGHPLRWRIFLSLARLHMNPNYKGGCMTTAIQSLRQAISYDADSLPELLRKVADLLNSMSKGSIPQALHQSLLECYSCAVDLALLVSGFVLDHAAQLKYLNTCQGLVPGAFSLAITTGNLGDGVELVDRARGIVWSQSLHLRDPQLDALPLEVASELNMILRRLRETDIAPHVAFSNGNQATSLTVQDMRHQLHGRLQALLRKIREMPDMTDFMRGPTYKALMTIALSHPVVLLIACSGECHALVIRSPNEPPSSLALNDIQVSEMQEWISSSVSSTRMRGKSTAAETVSHRMGMNKSTLRPPPIRKGYDSNVMLAKLWRGVVKPILEHLGLHKIGESARPRVHWCPTGVFTFVPVHAAGIYEGSNQECCADYVVSSYTPTLATLLRAQRDAHASGDLFIRKLLLIAANSAEDRTLPTLWNVNDEIKYIGQLADSTDISFEATYANASSTTVTEVAASFESANFVHIACHGIQHHEEPLKSAFYLGGGRLTVEMLMKLNLKNAFFAFLSACETAKGDRTQPDQTIHLAATMLFVGFKSVIATMWAMNDEDGPEVAKLFYLELFKNKTIDVDTIPYALDHAVTALRKSGVSPDRWATFIHMGA